MQEDNHYETSLSSIVTLCIYRVTHPNKQKEIEVMEREIKGGREERREGTYTGYIEFRDFRLQRSN